VVRRRVSLGESISSTFENAAGSTSNPITDVIVCVLLGIWWWIAGIPNGEQNVATPKRTSARSATTAGWYQQDGRWYCEEHNTLYCNVCSS
jgi:hypothetical protein